MAENKKSFLLYTDVFFTVEKLTDEKAGQLFKHILAYVNDKYPETDDIILQIAFEPIKQSLKRDLRKYESIREKRSLAGLASANKRQQVSTSVEQNEQVSTHSTVSVSDNVSVINISFDVFWEAYGKRVGNKKLCMQRWNKLNDDERQKIIDTLPAFIASVRDPQFLPYPEKYLNGKRWEDELIPALTPGLSSPKREPQPGINRNYKQPV